MKPFTFSRSILFGFAAALAALAIYGQEAPRTVRFDYEVRNDFFAGFNGDKEALQRGLKRCEEILAANPNDPEALVWHGAGLYYEVGELMRKNEQQRGIKLYMQSMQEMDKAVALAPDSIGVRIPRGAVLLTATRFQPVDDRVKGEIAKGLTDYQRVYELQQDKWASVPTHPKGELLLGLANGYERTGDAAKAKSLYETAAKEMVGTVYAKNARKWLQTGSLEPQEQGCLGCHTGGAGK